MSFYLIECVILAKGTGNRSSNLMNPSLCTSSISCLCIRLIYQPLSETQLFEWATSGEYVCKTVSGSNRLRLSGLVLILGAERWAGTGPGYEKPDAESEQRYEYHPPPGYYLAGIFVALPAKGLLIKSRTHQVQAPTSPTCKVLFVVHFSDGLHHFSSKRCQKWSYKCSAQERLTCHQ